MEMILQLLLIFYLSSLGFSIEVKIEKERCNAETVCFIRKSCLASATDGEDQLIIYNIAEPLKEDLCDVFLQVRPFSKKKFHVMMQVSSSVDINSEGVTLKQREDQFKCGAGPVTTANTDLEISSFGDPRPYNPKLIFCSFILQLKDARFQITHIFDSNTAVPEISFFADQQNTIKYVVGGDDLWTKITADVKCDPDIILTADSSNGIFVNETVDNTRSSITCLTGKTLTVTRADRKIDYPQKVTCGYDKKWSYERKIGNQIEVQTISEVNGVQEKITVTCALKLCSLCEKVAPLSTCATCVQAEYPDRKDPTDCVKATCPLNRWRVPQVNAWILANSMECKHKQGSPNAKEVAWYMTSDNFNEGPGEQEVAEASCTKDERCWEINGFSNPCVAGDCSALSINKEQTKVWCDEGYDLIQVNEATKERNIFKEAKCDPLTGNYIGDGKKEIPRGSQIWCARPSPPSTTPSSAPSGASALEVGKWVGVGIGGLFLLALPLLVFKLVKFAQRRKKEKKAAEERAKVQEEAEMAVAEAIPAVLEPDFDRETKWANRPRIREVEKEMPDPAYLKDWGWNDQKFEGISIKFPQWRLEGKLSILMNLCAFDAFSLDNITKEVKKQDEQDRQYGNLKQFVMLWKQSARQQMDCFITWEYMWRFARILFDNYSPRDDEKKSAKRITRLVTGWARPMYNELGIQQKRNEEAVDSLIRCLAVRMLLWAEAPDVIEELRLLAEEPIEKLQTPIRYVIFQYAVRYQNRGKELFEAYWKEVQADSQETTTLLFGSLRQHLLYGLCTARDETKKDTEGEFKILNFVMDNVFDFTKPGKKSASFTPSDQLWAMRGAAEYGANMRISVDAFIKFVPERMLDPEVLYKEFLMWKCNHNKDDYYKLRPEFKKTIIDLIRHAFEMCTNRGQVDELQVATAALLYYATPQDDPGAPPPINIAKYQERTFNLGSLIGSPLVARIFHQQLKGVGAADNPDELAAAKAKTKAIREAQEKEENKFILFKKKDPNSLSALI